jgi:small subunit ribosomal protein S13
VPRIAGVDLPGEKRIEIALTYIFGIGRSAAKEILNETGVDPNVRTKNLSEEDTAKLRNVIESEHKVEGALRSEVSGNIKRLMDIGCYRGLRHRRGLPARGQEGCNDPEEEREQDLAKRRCRTWQSQRVEGRGDGTGGWRRAVSRTYRQPSITP